MRKRTVLSILLCSLLTTLVAVSGIAPAKASISGTPTWIGPQYDEDDYYGASFTANSIAFTTGTNATLRVTVNNPSTTKPLNISAVKVLIDWGINYSSTEASKSSPHVIPKTSSGLTYYYTFKIVFEVPAITTASNLFRHYWWVYVEEVNATSGAQAVTLHDKYSGAQDFTVYSSDQATAQNSRIEYDRLYTTFSPTSKIALELKKNAETEYSEAVDSYKAGDFSGAKTHYGAALTLLKNARSTDETYLTNVQNNSVELTEAQIRQANATAARDEAYAKLYEGQAKMYESQTKYYEGQGSYYNKTGEAQVKEAEAAMIEANATMKIAEAQWALAQAASLQSTALNLFGFGFILFGVAAIVWAFKRPKPPP